MADRRAPAAALAAVALACGGCFGSGDKPAPTPSGEISASSPMTILAPDDGQTLRATTSLTDSLRAMVAVSGRTAPDSAVSVSSDCGTDRCADRAHAAIDGQWQARVLVAVARGNPVATIVAINADDPTDRAEVTVRLHGKPPPKPKKRKPTPARPKATTIPTPAPTAPKPRTPAPRTLLMIGDSLAEGTEPLLPGLLPGWSVRSDAKQSRPLSTGMQILAGTDLGSAPAVLAFSLFTNDDPRNVSALESAVRTSVQRAGPGGCAVWATIVRPPVNGVSYAAANRRLTQLASEPGLAGRLLIVPWAAATGANPSWLAGDGVHATPEGYRARAQMYADAARACGG